MSFALMLAINVKAILLRLKSNILYKCQDKAFLDDMSAVA